MRIILVWNVKPVSWWGAAAVTAYPFIFFAMPKKQATEILVKHEWQHVRQVRTFGFFKFGWLYFVEFLRTVWVTRSFWRAHALNKFEMEADDAEKTLFFTDREKAELQAAGWPP